MSSSLIISKILIMWPGYGACPRVNGSTHALPLRKIIGIVCQRNKIMWPGCGTCQSEDSEELGHYYNSPLTAGR